MMNNNERKIALPKRKFEDATDKFKLERVAKRSNIGLVEKVERVLGNDFRKIEDSFMGPIIKMARRQSKMVFSRHLTHHLLLRRIELGDKNLWFSFGEQPMRFSLREFHLATGLPCVPEGQVETPKSKKKKDPWMTKNETLHSLIKLFEKHSSDFTADQRLRLGATILVEGILMAINPATRIPEENLVRASNFRVYCKYPWGNMAYDFLRKEIKGISIKTLQKEQYGICGFIYAVHLWALSSVDEFEKCYFGIRDPEIEYPLCLHWIETKPLTMEEVIRFDTDEKVDVKCVIGDPELHSNLVEEGVENEFGRVLDLVKRGYRLKKQDWINGSVNVDVAEEEVVQKTSVPGSDSTDKEKIEYLAKEVEFLRNRVKHLETIFKIGQETGNGQNDQPILADTEIFESFVDAVRQEKKKGEKRQHEGEEEQVRNDSEKQGTGTSKMNEDGEEVNEDTKKETEQGITTRGRGKKRDDASTSKSKKQKNRHSLEELALSLEDTVKRMIAGEYVSKEPLSKIDQEKIQKVLDYIKSNLNEDEYSYGMRSAEFYLKLMIPRESWPRDDYGWLIDSHMASVMLMFHRRSMKSQSPYSSSRIAFLDRWFVKTWVNDYKKYDQKTFKWPETYIKVFNGEYPAHFISGKKWLVDVDSLFLCHHVNGNHWVALHIDLPKKVINVYDSIPTILTEAKMREECRPFMKMIPALLNKMLDPLMSTKQFTYLRHKRIPRNEDPGDCGLYTLKYIECLAEGKKVDGFSDETIPALRLKMGAEIYEEVGMDDMEL